MIANKPWCACRDDSCSVWSKRYLSLVYFCLALWAVLSLTVRCKSICSNMQCWVLVTQLRSNIYLSVSLFSLALSFLLFSLLSLSYQKQRTTMEYFGSAHALCWWSFDCPARKTWRLPSRLDWWKYIHVNVGTDFDAVCGGSVFMIVHLLAGTWNVERVCAQL